LSEKAAVRVYGLLLVDLSAKSAEPLMESARDLATSAAVRENLAEI
jgi:hypothetical protein